MAIEVSRTVGSLTIVAKCDAGRKPFVRIEGVDPISGSARYPDSGDMRGKIRAAGYLAAINRDDAVVARPVSATAKPNWISVNVGQLRGLRNVSESLSDVCNAICSAAEEAARGAAGDLVAKQALAASAASGNSVAYEAITKLLKELNSTEKLALYEQLRAELVVEPLE